VILNATYMLTLVQRLFYGPESEMAIAKPTTDLKANELVALWPLALLMLAMGVAPSVWMEAIERGAIPPAAAQRMVAPQPAAPALAPAVSASIPGEGPK